MDKNKILNGIIIAILTGVIGLLFWMGKGVYNFHQEWKEDEATEEAVMFDEPEQKVETLRHIDRIKTDEIGKTLYKQRVMDSLVLDKLEQVEQHQKAQDCLFVRLNDQYYQLNQKINN